MLPVSLFVAIATLANAQDRRQRTHGTEYAAGTITLRQPVQIENLKGPFGFINISAPI